MKTLGVQGLDVSVMMGKVLVSFLVHSGYGTSWTKLRVGHTLGTFPVRGGRGVKKKAWCTHTGSPLPSQHEIGGKVQFGVP